MGKGSGWKESLSSVFDVIGEILAVVLVLVFTVLLLNSEFHFLDSVDTVRRILEGVRGYGTLLLVAVVGLEAMVKRNFLFFLIFAALIALCVVFMFFPEARSYLTGLIPA